MSIATGYGPSHTSQRWFKLLFDGDEKNYELWETRFLAHMELRGLGAVLQQEAEDDEDARAEDEAKNGEAYAELVQCLDDKSLSLVMRDARNNGRKALEILREHYAGKDKPRVVSLYCELSSLQMTSKETVTDYIIRAETIFTSLRRADENISDGLQIAMVVKGLPDSYKPFVVHITQTNDTVTFSEFKTKLRSYESTERYGRSDVSVEEDNVMKTIGGTRSRGRQRGKKVDMATIECYTCGKKGHMARTCLADPQLKREEQNWGTPQRGRGRGRGRGRDYMNKAEEEATSFCFFKMSDCPMQQEKKSLLVDCGATTHMINDATKFKTVDKNFKPENHVIELADGTKVKGMAKMRGDAEIYILDSEGRQVKTRLKQALFVPSFPQNIFSVKAATANGAELHFKNGDNWLFHKNGTKFEVKVYGRLYYLNTVENENVDEIYGCHDIQTWHRILGHCNLDDVAKLEKVVKGMTIKGKQEGSNQNCEVCIQGKFTQNRNRQADAKAKTILELVHTDLCGPIEPVGKDGYKYAITFTDDYSGMIFPYFIKAKSGTTKATEKFIADVAPYGKIKCIRSDNGTEFTGQPFQTLLRSNGIRHETSAPYSPHQNGTAERGWRTLFEMSRCMLLESKLPKHLWTYAVQTAAQIRNRCYSRRLEQTPYCVFTGKTPDLSNMKVFGSECYVYKQDKKKLDSRCEKGIFLGYDKYSPAYNVYYPEVGKIQKHRLIKCLTKSSADSQTQTDFDVRNVFEIHKNTPPNMVDQNEVEPKASVEPNLDEFTGADSTESTQEGEEVRYPTRQRKAPEYLKDYQCKTECDNDDDEGVDYFYKVAYGVPITFKEAMDSKKSKMWKNAMREEMNSLKENETFILMPLPEGKQAVGGRWVYAVKESPDGSETYKARYVAKGYGQKEGIDYKETFSPTASMTSVRALMQVAVQEDLTLHQMDVKTAYLHAPMDCEVYVEQPEGFEVKSKTGEHLVCKLNKSLYGLKQSGRNWNLLLHDYLEENGFVQNDADHCVYNRGSESGKVILLVWVDDLIIAASDNTLLRDVKEVLKKRFKMKDMGPLKHFLGIDFSQGEGEIKMTQKRHIEKVLTKLGMSDCKPRFTPGEQKLSFDSEGEIIDPTGYREMVGSLIYIMTCTRPDLSWIVSKLSQHLAEPKQQHWSAAKHLLRYLKGTRDQELHYHKSEKGLKLEGYSDADWASDKDDRRSTTGYCFSLTENGPVISWKSRKQSTVALSTCEAEYMALAAATQESMYLVQLLRGVDSREHVPVKIYEDNQGAIALSKNPVCTQRSKHIDIKFHFVRSAHTEGKISIEYCPTENMIADVLTKSVTKVKFESFKEYLFGK